MRLLFAIIIVSVTGCSHSDAGNISFWEKQKNNFKYHTKTEFVINDTLLVDLKSLKKVPLHLYPWLDTVYLYSWQNSDKFKNEFTVIGNEGKYGPSIFYVITDKKDSVISSIRIAGYNDSGYGSMFKTVFVTKDTFFIGGGLHVIDENGEIAVILRQHADSTKTAK